MLGSRSVHRETCSIEQAAAFSRREHTWISLRAQARKHVHATDCCVRTPQAILALSPCAKRHVPAKPLLRSHATSTLGSRSVRKETCYIEKTTAISRCPPRQMTFTCGRQIQFLQSNAHTSFTLSGTRDPKPQSPRLRFTDCRPHKRIRCWGNMPLHDIWVTIQVYKLPSTSKSLYIELSGSMDPLVM